jgi:polyhydroxyalkanoate synthase subunit PhaE
MFAGAAAGFYELLKAFGAHAGGVGGGGPDLSSLGRALGVQFEQWLKYSQAPGLSPGAGLAAPEGRALWDLLMQLAQLQAQLGAHWSAIASDCVQRFLARSRTAGGGGLSSESALRLYELWVDCAEEAYAVRVRSDEFASLQARLANTTAELLLLQRRQAEQLARTWGLEPGAPAAAARPAKRSKQRQKPRARPAAPRPRGAAPRRAGRRRGRRPRA